LGHVAAAGCRWSERQARRHRVTA